MKRETADGALRRAVRVARLTALRLTKGLTKGLTEAQFAELVEKGVRDGLAAIGIDTSIEGQYAEKRSRARNFPLLAKQKRGGAAGALAWAERAERGLDVWARDYWMWTHFLCVLEADLASYYITWDEILEASRPFFFPRLRGVADPMHGAAALAVLAPTQHAKGEARSKLANELKLGSGFRFAWPTWRGFWQRRNEEPSRWSGGERWERVGDHAVVLYDLIRDRVPSSRRTLVWGVGAVPNTYNHQACALVARIVTHLYGLFLSKPLTAADIKNRVRQRRGYVPDPSSLPPTLNTL